MENIDLLWRPLKKGKVVRRRTRFILFTLRIWSCSISVNLKQGTSVFYMQLKDNFSIIQNLLNNIQLVHLDSENRNLQPTLDTEGQLSENGGWGQTDHKIHKYKRFTSPRSVWCTVEIVVVVLIGQLVAFGWSVCFERGCSLGEVSLYGSPVHWPQPINWKSLHRSTGAGRGAVTCPKPSY